MPNYTTAQQNQLDRALYSDEDREAYGIVSGGEMTDYDLAVFVAPVSSIGQNNRRGAIEKLSLIEARRLRAAMDKERKRIERARALLLEADKAVRDALLGEAD